MGWVGLCISTHWVKGYLTEILGSTLSADDIPWIFSMGGPHNKAVTWNTPDIPWDKLSQVPHLNASCNSPIPGNPVMIRVCSQ